MDAKLDPLAVTISRTQQLLSVSRNTVYGLIARGEIASIKIGKRRLVILSSLKAFLEQGDAK